MKRFFAIAAISLATTSAQAGDSYSFDVGGRTVHIDAPSDCRSTSCVSVSIPGVYESGPRRPKRAKAKDDSEDQARSNSQVKPAESNVASPAREASPPKTTGNEASLEPANGTPAAASIPTPVARPAEATTAAPPQPAADVASKPAASETVVATAPVAAPVQKQQTPAPSTTARLAASPLGVWLTEEKEGRVRIEQCGNNLCGYSVNARTDANGDKVLINMKPVNDVKWSGRIFDPNSGSTYDSTIALKGSDSLRVQGCAFGGMFCGGQTWSRVN